MSRSQSNKGDYVCDRLYRCSDLRALPRCKSNVHSQLKYMTEEIGNGVLLAVLIIKLIVEEQVNVAVAKAVTKPD